MLKASVNSFMPRRPNFGQFMTPGDLANLVALGVPSTSSCVLDLASGRGALLEAVRKHRDIPVVGIDLDERFHNSHGGDHRFRLIVGDGLEFDIKSLKLPRDTAIVGNPPYGLLEPREVLSKILEAAFPTLQRSTARHKAEVYFLARSLALAGELGGTVSIVLPITFASGESFRPFRRALMESWHIEEAIELPVASFTGTEARTVILRICKMVMPSRPTTISAYDGITRKIKRVVHATLTPGDRLDARYHFIRCNLPKNLPTLGEVGATVDRGRISRKLAEMYQLDAVHTTDLRRWKNHRVALSGNRLGAAVRNEHVIAGPGDILLSRTGSRVSWKPVYVTSGTAPITDHVFRIRIPISARKRVQAAFTNPQFLPWVEGTMTGVCASVLTKKDLLEMPIFASQRTPNPR